MKVFDICKIVRDCDRLRDIKQFFEFWGESDD